MQQCFPLDWEHWCLAPLISRIYESLSTGSEMGNFGCTRIRTSSSWNPKKKKQRFLQSFVWVQFILPRFVRPFDKNFEILSLHSWDVGQFARNKPPSSPSVDNSIWRLYSILGLPFWSGGWAVQSHISAEPDCTRPRYKYSPLQLKNFSNGESVQLQYVSHAIVLAYLHS